MRANGQAPGTTVSTKCQMQCNTTTIIIIINSDSEWYWEWKCGKFHSRRQLLNTQKPWNDQRMHTVTVWNVYEWSFDCCVRVRIHWNRNAYVCRALLQQMSNEINRKPITNYQTGLCMCGACMRYDTTNIYPASGIKLNHMDKIMFAACRRNVKMSFGADARFLWSWFRCCNL